MEGSRGIKKQPSRHFQAKRRAANPGANCPWVKSHGQFARILRGAMNVRHLPGNSLKVPAKPLGNSQRLRRRIVKRFWQFAKSGMRRMWKPLAICQRLHGRLSTEAFGNLPKALFGEDRLYTEALGNLPIACSERIGTCSSN